MEVKGYEEGVGTGGLEKERGWREQGIGRVRGDAFLILFHLVQEPAHVLAFI